MDVGGTTPWTGDDSRDGGGRVVSGTTTAVEPRRERRSRATQEAKAEDRSP
ncbi:MAG: hypothetical protein ACI909_003607 [Planctomycetota bacterium]|jgi:hypothetical protein